MNQQLEQLSNSEKEAYYRLLSQIDKAAETSPNGPISFAYEEDLSNNVIEVLKGVGVNVESIRKLGNEEANIFLITSESARIVEMQPTCQFDTWYEDFCNEVQCKPTFTTYYEEEEEKNAKQYVPSFIDQFKNMFKKEENELLTELYPPEEKQVIPIPAWELCKKLFKKIKQLELGKKVEKFFEIIENIISRIEEKYAEADAKAEAKAKAKAKVEEKRA